MHVFALNRDGEFIEAVVKEILEGDRAHLFFPRVAGRKIEDTTLSLRLIAHPDEPIAVVRTLWRETEENPRRFRLDRNDYPDFHRPAERWPYGAMIFETGRNELFFGPVDTPAEMKPMLRLPTKPVVLDLPRRPTHAYDEGLAFQKRNRNFFSRF